jgi:Xaa-Pro dipeptidase
VLFAHMILMDSETGMVMCLGRTSIVSEQGSTPITLTNLELTIR